MTPMPTAPGYGLAAPRSEALFARARNVIPGGVNSPVRAFRSTVAVTWTSDPGADDPGHGHPAVLDAVARAATAGLSFGTPTEGEVALAEEIVARIAPVQKVRLVSSGTEATMSAIRLARGFTGSAAQRMSRASHDELLATLRAEVRTLRQENHALRDRLATAIGENRVNQRQRHVADRKPQDTTNPAGTSSR